MAKNKSKSEFTGVTIDSKILVKAIDRVGSVVSGNGAVYAMHFGSPCYLLGVRDGTFCRVNLEQNSEHVGMVTIADVSSFKALVKNRGNVDLLPVSNSLTIKSGRYKSEVKFNQSSDILIVSSIETFMRRADSKNKKAKGLSVDTNFFTRVSRSVAATRLINPFEESFISTASVALFDGELSVIAFDSWHIHLLRTPVTTETPNFSICITTGIFSILDKVISGDATFSMSSDDFVISGEDIDVVLPPVQDNNSKDALKFLEGLDKPITTFKAATVKVGDTLDNIAGLLKGKDKDGTKIEFGFDEKYLKLSLTTDSGSVSDRFKLDKFKSRSKVTNITVDPRIFYDTFKVMKNCPEFTFRIYPNEEGIPGLYSMEGKSDIGKLIVVGYIGT